MIILSYDQRWWQFYCEYVINKLNMMIIIFWEYDDLVIWPTLLMRLLWLIFCINKLAMMTMILKCVHDWFNQRWVNLHTFILRFIHIHLKLSPLMRNYLAEQERLLNKKLSCSAREVWVSLFKIKSLDVKLSCRVRKE
jgi:hypothetical protein